MLTVYSKADCPFCDRAKALLTLKQVAYTEVRIDQDDQARQFIIEQGHRTVPQIYRDGELFVAGGFTGLTKLSEDVFQELRNLSNAH